jgi:polyisoprenyl-phosphate glycosyltransferase
MTNRKYISIISPCFNEQDNVRECFLAVRRVFEPLSERFDYEHIFADNASTDNTVEELREIAAEDKRVKVIANSRNYGPFRSTFNALRNARGDAVLAMLPVDLQDPVELIPEFLREWERGFKVIYGQRTKREEGLVIRSCRKIYYRLVNGLAGIDIPLDTAEFQLLDRQVVNALLKFNDHYPYIRGMIANVGFRGQAKAIPYQWQARARGMSKNRLYNLLDQGLNGIVSFTNVPMRLAVIAGFALACIALIYALIQFVINLLYKGLSEPGIPTLIIALFFFSGVQLIFIGLLGEYVGAIHSQVRQGAVVIERERINFDE